MATTLDPAREQGLLQCIDLARASWGGEGESGGQRNRGQDARGPGSMNITCSPLHSVTPGIVRGSLGNGKPVSPCEELVYNHFTHQVLMEYLSGITPCTRWLGLIRSQRHLPPPDSGN